MVLKKKWRLIWEFKWMDISEAEKHTKFSGTNYPTEWTTTVCLLMERECSKRKRIKKKKEYKTAVDCSMKNESGKHNKNVSILMTLITYLETNPVPTWIYRRHIISESPDMQFHRIYMYVSPNLFPKYSYLEHWGFISSCSPNEM